MEVHHPREKAHHPLRLSLGCGADETFVRAEGFRLSLEFREARRDHVMTRLSGREEEHQRQHVSPPALVGV